MQWQFWVERKRLDSSGEPFTEETAKSHVRSFRKCNWEYWSRVDGLDKDKAVEKALEHNRKYLKHAHSAITGTDDTRTTQVKYWIKQGFTESEAKTKVSERQSTFSLKKCKEKYGDEEGYKIWKQRQVKWKKSFDAKNKNGEIDKLKRNNLENFIERGKTLNDYCLYRIKVNKSDEYIVKKTKRFIVDNSIEQTTENFNLYYYHFLKIKNDKKGQASNESLKLFIPLYKFCRKLGINRNDILFGVSGSKEYYLKRSPSGKNKKSGYFLDFTIKSLNIVVEYNGYVYHPCRDTMSEDMMNRIEKFFNNTKHLRYTLDEKIELDKKKREFIVNSGFSLYEYWSHKDHDEQIMEIKKFIREKYESYCKTNS